jgi:hypothetical protein
MGIFKDLFQEIGRDLANTVREMADDAGISIPIKRSVSGTAGRPADFVYDLNKKGDSVVIKGLKRKIKTVNIPETIEGFPVKEIESLDLDDGLEWDASEGKRYKRYINYCIPIDVINIPETVVRFGKNAFSKTAIKEIILPQGIKSLSDGLFCQCLFLRSIQIPADVTSINEDAFSTCYSLTEIQLPEGLTVIGNYAFAGCDNLHIITLPNSLISIGSMAFKRCEKLRQITLPESLKSIGWGAFSDCENLVSVKCLLILLNTYMKLKEMTSTLRNYQTLFQAAPNSPWLQRKL